MNEEILDARKYSPSAAETEKNANDAICGKLRKLFSTQKNIELLENPSKSNQDWGIDYFMEASNRNDKSREVFFLLQNKGSHGGFHVLKDKSTISFPLSLRHAQLYFYQVEQPLMIMFCDTDNASTVYWYPIQLDAEIEKKILKGIESNTDNVQLHVSTTNVLNEENFEKFLLDLAESQKVQFHKFKAKIALKADYDETKRTPNDKTIVDHILRVLDLFEGIHVIPTNIITKLYPFKGKDKTSLYGENLSTDNEEFFDFMSNLSFNNDQIELLDANVDYFDIPEFQDKIKKILGFFIYNYIRHVEWSGKGTKTRICVHVLFSSGGCDCERCAYGSLNLLKAKEILSRPHETLKAERKLRKGYTYFLMSDYIGAYEMHKEVLKDLNISKHPSLYTIAKFNMLQIKNFIYSSYFGSDRHEILRELEKENFVLDEILMPAYFIDVFKVIKGNDFINNALWRIDNSLTDIQKVWLSDKRGGEATNSHAENLMIDFTRAYNFIEYNLLIYNDYRDFEVLVNKAIEGFLAMYDIVNSASSKYESLSSTVIDRWLFHAEPKHIRHLLISKYRIQSLRIEDADGVFEDLNTYIQNLIDSSEVIIKNFEDQNHSHSDKIRKIISNYLLIIGVIEITPEQRNILFEKYLHLIKKLEKWYFTVFEFVSFFLSCKHEVTKENLEKTLELLILHNHFRHDAFSSAMLQYVEKSLGADIEETVKKMLQLDEITVGLFRSGEKLSDSTWLINHFSEGTKNNLANEVVERLRENFDDDLYYNFAAYDIIGFHQDLFQKFVDQTPDYTKRQTGHQILTGKKLQKNYHLTQVVDQIFKYDVPITAELMALSERAGEQKYYEWLLDMENFDYSLFKPYWILHQTNVNYFKAYRRSEKLKVALAGALKTQYIEQISRVFLNIFF